MGIAIIVKAVPAACGHAALRFPQTPQCSNPVFQNVRRQLQHLEGRVADGRDLIVYRVLGQHPGGQALRQLPLPIRVPGLAAIVPKQAGHALAQRLHALQLGSQGGGGVGAFVQVVRRLPLRRPPWLPLRGSCRRSRLRGPQAEGLFRGNDQSIVGSHPQMPT